jgi:BMFP domain-containing protein YqiC
MATGNLFEDFQQRLSRIIAASPARDLEKNVKAFVSSGLGRLDVVTREEFDVQAKVLARTREKLEALEKRVAELEARLGGRPD